MLKLLDQLKDALANNNTVLLSESRSTYDIDHRFPDEDNDTLLLYALSLPESDSYLFILEHGGDIYAVNDLNENAIHSLVFSRDIERLRLFTKRYPEATATLINRQSSDGTTPLLLAALLNEPLLFNYLIEIGADVNISDFENVTPLHIACHSGSMEMVRSLIEHKADLHIKSKQGNYPLALAVCSDHEEIVQYLFPLFYHE